MSSPWSARPARDLPDGLILFDGVCVFCSRWVQFVIARDPAMRWRFVPVQSPYGRELAARFGIDPDAPETNVVVAGGLAHFKLDAALAVLRGWPAWSWTRVAHLVPHPLADWLYDRVARNRYRLFGRTEHCLVPSPETAARFLTTRPG